MNRGLTLIELIVAIAVVSVITTLSWLSIKGASDVAEEQESRARLSAMGRTAIDRMRRELSASFVSANQGEHFKTIFRATDRDPIDEVIFVARAHEKRYADVREADYAEFAYWSESDLHGGTFRSLMHREAEIVDEEPEEGGTIQPLCHDVRTLNLRYYDADKEEWVDEWDSEGPDTPNRVPRAIEIRLELEDKDGRTAAFFTRSEVMP